ncbi:purine and uridine phosphorylase [Aspergillus californicus]
MDINTQRTHADYTIGWICALPVELAASQVMLDATHAPLPQRESDHNVYTLGEAHGHNVVIAGLPAGIYGISSSAIVASQLLMTFPSIRFSLMVGIGGGVPGPKNPDIRLGDVVVSKPTGTFGGVVQYDYGKTIIDQRFHRTGALNKPPSTLLAAVTKLQADHMIGSSRIPDCLWELRRRYSPHGTMFVYPGSRYDVLFEAEREHVEPDPNGECTRCDNETQVFRIQRISTAPRIHYGLIASGNQVMRNGLMRDSISRELNGEVLCFEMEAAGLMDNFNCLVIRGICDYADSHKNKLWQPYAAAVAAAYAKELLSVIPLVQAEETLVGNEQ